MQKVAAIPEEKQIMLSMGMITFSVVTLKPKQFANHGQRLLQTLTYYTLNFPGATINQSLSTKTHKSSLTNYQPGYQAF